MRHFPGANRRVFVRFDRGRVAHLRRSIRVSTGPITFCGRAGGTMTSWSEVGGLEAELCRVCSDLSGVSEAIERQRQRGAA